MSVGPCRPGVPDTFEATRLRLAECCGCITTEMEQTHPAERGKGAMSRYMCIALTNPVEGREQEFNEWYDNQHIPDVLSVPGCVSAQRFKLSDVQLPNRPSPYRYLAVYEFESDAAQRVVKAIVEAPMPLSDAVSRDPMFLTPFFEPLGPKIEKKL